MAIIRIGEEILEVPDTDEQETAPAPEAPAEPEAMEEVPAPEPTPARKGRMTPAMRVRESLLEAAKED